PPHAANRHGAVGRLSTLPLRFRHLGCDRVAEWYRVPGSPSARGRGAAAIALGGRADRARRAAPTTPILHRHHVGRASGPGRGRALPDAAARLRWSEPVAGAPNRVTQVVVPHTGPP